MFSGSVCVLVSASAWRQPTSLHCRLETSHSRCQSLWEVSV